MIAKAGSASKQIFSGRDGEVVLGDQNRNRQSRLERLWLMVGQTVPPTSLSLAYHHQETYHASHLQDNRDIV